MLSPMVIFINIYIFANIDIFSKLWSEERICFQFMGEWILLDLKKNLFYCQHNSWSVTILHLMTSSWHWRGCHPIENGSWWFKNRFIFFFFSWNTLSPTGFPCYPCGFFSLFFRSLLKCHLLRVALPDSFISTSNPHIQSFLSLGFLLPFFVTHAAIWHITYLFVSPTRL